MSARGVATFSDLYKSPDIVRQGAQRSGFSIEFGESKWV